MLSRTGQFLPHVRSSFWVTHTDKGLKLVSLFDEAETKILPGPINNKTEEARTKGQTI